MAPTCIDEILSQLQEVKKNSSGWMTLCPTHNDREPSLSIGEGEDGRVLLKCFAGCSVEEVVAPMGLKMAGPVSGTSRRGGQPPENSTIRARIREARSHVNIQAFFQEGKIMANTSKIKTQYREDRISTELDGLSGGPSPRTLG